MPLVLTSSANLPLDTPSAILPRSLHLLQKVIRRAKGRHGQTPSKQKYQLALPLNPFHIHLYYLFSFLLSMLFTCQKATSRQATHPPLISPHHQPEKTNTCIKLHLPCPLLTIITKKPPLLHIRDLDCATVTRSFPKTNFPCLLVTSPPIQTHLLRSRVQTLRRRTVIMPFFSSPGTRGNQRNTPNMPLPGQN